MKQTTKFAYVSPGCRAVEIVNSEILCVSTSTESYSKGTNNWTSGEDESFFNN